MKQSISQIKNSLQKKTISVEELHDEFLNKAKLNTNNTFNLIIDKAHNKSLIDESQKRYDNSNSLPLDGIPLGIKDLFCTKGTRTTASSKILSNFIPNYESFVTQQLLNCLLYTSPSPRD